MLPNARAFATIPHSPWNPVGLTTNSRFRTKFERGTYERIPDLSAQGFSIEGRVNQNDQISSKEDEAAQCWQTRHRTGQADTPAPYGAEDLAGGARRQAGRQLPAGPEVREGREPRRRCSSSADRDRARRARHVLLRRRRQGARSRKPPLPRQRLQPPALARLQQDQKPDGAASAGVPDGVDRRERGLSGPRAVPAHHQSIAVVIS